MFYVSFYICNVVKRKYFPNVLDVELDVTSTMLHFKIINGL